MLWSYNDVFFVFNASSSEACEGDDGSSVGVQAGQAGSDRDTTNSDRATGMEGEGGTTEESSSGSSTTESAASSSSGHSLTMADPTGGNVPCPPPKVHTPPSQLPHTQLSVPSPLREGQSPSHQAPRPLPQFPLLP